MANESGYRACACRDCAEVVMGVRGDMCHDCVDAGCDGGECGAPQAYGCDEEEEVLLPIQFEPLPADERGHGTDDRCCCRYCSPVSGVAVDNPDGVWDTRATDTVTGKTWKCHYPELHFKPARRALHVGGRPSCPETNGYYQKGGSHVWGQAWDWKAT